MIKAKRLIYNKSYNDFNEEPEYKLQNVRIHSEEAYHYIVDSDGTKFKASKSKVFLNKNDFFEKIDKIFGVYLSTEEIMELASQFKK